ncbi:MAG: hypothetical protein M3Q49_02580 [Actinomycetota bacterium]|nr:hypothetical protein [Actinomycetota bacterium]MDP9484674.1 hypothetical protein [Actinomycetota bacterium]
MLHLYRKYTGLKAKVHWSIVAYLDATTGGEHPFGYHPVEVVPEGGIPGPHEAVALVLSSRLDHQTAPFGE